MDKLQLIHPVYSSKKHLVVIEDSTFNIEYHNYGLIEISSDTMSLDNKGKINKTFKIVCSFISMSAGKFHCYR